MARSPKPVPLASRRSIRLRNATRLTAIACLLCATASLFAEDAAQPERANAVKTEDLSVVKRVLPAVKLSRPPVIDGDLSDPAWKEAAQTTRFTDVISGQPVQDQTVVYFGYDDQWIYVGIHAFDGQPGGIVAQQTKRGSSLSGDDDFALSLDLFHNHSFNDRNWFMVNPIGTQFAHLASGRGSKLEWEGAWKSAARIVSDGWTAEMAIPWKILNYPVSKAPVACDLNFDRYQQRTKIHSWWSNVGEKEEYELDGTWSNVQYPSFRRTFSLLPYAAPDWSEKEGAEFRSGLDIRGALTPSMTLVGTVNPDFKNIEQSVEGIDFSYGERFISDQRPFFQEGANFYNSGGVAGNYVYTPRIDNFDTGINLYGKVDPKDSVGLLGAFDFGNRSDWILRARRVLATNFSVDTALINRDESGNHNRVFGVGENFRKGRWGLDASSFGSWENGKRLGNASNAFFYFQSPKWYNQIALYTVSPKFRDDLGYIPFTDYRGYNGDFNYNREWRKGPFQSLGMEFFSQHDEHFDGRRYRNQNAFWTGLTTRQDTKIIFSWTGGPYEENDDSVTRIRLQPHQSNPFNNYGIDYQWGRQGGADYGFLTPFITHRFGEKLTMNLSSSLLSYKGSEYQHIFTFNYDITPQRGISGRLVSQNGGTGGYLAYRRSGYGGTEMWLIVGDPNAPKFQNRIAAKIVYPLSL